MHQKLWCPRHLEMITSRQFDDLRAGFNANLVVAASVGAYGSVLGLMAAQKGLTWYQLLIMNLSVFAGSAQFVMVDMWLPPLPVAEIILAVLVINMRYLLIGASLNPLFQSTSLRHKMGFMHLVADENWAMTMARFHKGGDHHLVSSGRRHLCAERLVLRHPARSSAGCGDCQPGALGS